MALGHLWDLFSVVLVAMVGVSALNGSSNTNSPFLLKGEDVSRGALAAELSWIVNNDKDAEPTTPNGASIGRIYLSSGTDAVYLARVGDSYCAASFLGTQGFPPTDWWTNLELDPVVVGGNNSNHDNESSSSTQSCDVHGGYHDAYAAFEHRDTVERFWTDCAAACETCEMVLTGHSQGGAIAAVAALYLKHPINHSNSDEEVFSGTSNATNATATTPPQTTTVPHHRRIPYVITFGAPPSLGAGCQSFFSEEERRRWFRYILSGESRIGRTKRVYDPIPLLYSRLLDSEGEPDGTLSWFDEGVFGIRLPTEKTYARSGGLADIGYEILLSAEDPSSVLLTGFDVHRFVDPEYMDVSGRTHQDYVYLDVLRAQNDLYQQHLQQQPAAVNENGEGAVGDSSWFLSSDGFPEGSLCNPDETSTSPIATNITTTCAEGLVCEPDENEEEWWESASYTCLPRVPQQPQAPPDTPDDAALQDESLSVSGSEEAIAARESQETDAHDEDAHEKDVPDKDAQAVFAVAATTDAAFLSASTPTNRSGSPPLLRSLLSWTVTAFGAAVLSMVGCLA